MNDQPAPSHAAIRDALPVLFQDDFDELEDVARLAMSVDAAVPVAYRDDVVAYLTGIWSLAAALRGDLTLDETAVGTIRNAAASAMGRLRQAGLDEAFAVRNKVIGDVWQIPDEQAAKALLEF